MKVISTNIAKQRTIDWKGKEVKTGIFKEPVPDGIILGLHDVVGDSVVDRRFHGGLNKACYLYSADHYPFWETKYGHLDWKYGMFGENITIEGLDERKIFIGDIFRLGSAKVQITQPRQPCAKLGLKFNDPGIIRAFISVPFSGVYVKVLEEGKVTTGDLLVEEQVNRSDISIADIYHVLYQPQENEQKINKALENPFLPESTKTDILRKHRP